MTTRVADLDKLQNWLNTQPERYVVLRDKQLHGQMLELNLLADAELAVRLEATFPRTRNGVKIDVYGHKRSDYLGFPHLANALAERCLAERSLVPRDTDRQLMANWYRPRADDELAALLYHLAYHKPDASGLALDRIAPFNEAGATSSYAGRLSTLYQQTGVTPFAMLPDVHDWLKAQSLSLDKQRLNAYVRYQFSRNSKSYFHAWLMNQAYGELNLYVIRGVAVKFKQTDALLSRLSAQYQLLRQKTVPWDQRLFKMRHMRGGKWKRGGKPHLAVLVFDNQPIAASETERRIHPFVFNARQFIKREWREWFTATTGARPQDNPIHSTDNEAEAIGHLPLFFDEQEEQQILQELAALRAANEMGVREENHVP